MPLNSVKYYVVVAALITATGCAVPGNTQASNTRILQPDEADNIGGSFIESTDIRTMASRMGAEILALPEVAQQNTAPIIAVAPVRNSTRYIFDQGLLTQKLVTELMRYGQGRVRFVQQGQHAQGVRETILSERNEGMWNRAIDQAAQGVAGCDEVAKATEPLRVAVLTPRNVNLTGMNAESFLQLVRAAVVRHCGGKVVFLSDERSKDADHWITGDFIADSIMEESAEKEKITATGWDRQGQYIVQNAGAAAAVAGEESGAVANVTVTTRSKPNVAKEFNVMLVRCSNGEIVYEKVVTVENKIKTGLGAANLLLTGEVKGLSKSSGGSRSDYVNVIFQLSDPASNLILWNGEYETKKVTNRGAVYQ